MSGVSCCALDTMSQPCEPSMQCSLCRSAACATVAEVRKRGVDFWSEFEFYLSDLVVGCVLDVVLVSLMAPTVAITAKRTRVGRARRRLPPTLTQNPTLSPDPDPDPNLDPDPGSHPDPTRCSMLRVGCMCHNRLGSGRDSASWKVSIQHELTPPTSHARVYDRRASAGEEYKLLLEAECKLGE